MNKIYRVEYFDDQAGLTLMDIEPYSSYVEELFYNGALLRQVNLDKHGQYLVTVDIDIDGDIHVLGKEKYIGWIDVAI